MNNWLGTKVLLCLILDVFDIDVLMQYSFGPSATVRSKTIKFNEYYTSLESITY